MARYCMPVEMDEGYDEELKAMVEPPFMVTVAKERHVPVSVSSQKRPLLASEEVRSRKETFCWNDSEGSPSKLSPSLLAFAVHYQMMDITDL